VEYPNEKKGKSWRNRLSGFFKREKKAKGNENPGERDTDPAKTKAKGKIKASEAPKVEEDSTKGRQPLLHSVR
jgi:hypothetical protein